MANALIFNMPMGLGREFMSIVGLNLTNTEREFGNNCVDEVCDVCLSMAIIDLEGADACCVINSCVLEMPDCFTIIPVEFKEFTSTCI